MEYSLSDIKNMFKVRFVAQLNENIDDFKHEGLSPDKFNHNLVTLIEKVCYNDDLDVEPFKTTDFELTYHINHFTDLLNSIKFKFLYPHYTKKCQKIIYNLKKVKDFIDSNKKDYFNLQILPDRVYHGPKLFESDHIFYHLKIKSNFTFYITEMKISDRRFTIYNLDNYNMNGDFSVTYKLTSDDGNLNNEFTSTLNSDYKSLSTAINSKLFFSKEDLIEFVNNLENNVFKLKEETLNV